MPPPIPDRYRLEIRLGRDHDIEEWLGIDLNLDRPVLIRILGPEADAKRRAEFLAVVRAAAAINHPHLEPIYAAEEVLDGAFSVSEWSGGLTLQGRLDSGQTLDPAEFLANASGLASALAAVHEAGLVHGAIDAGSILYTISRPARLGGFGRPRRYLVAPTLDVSDLAAVLEQSLTGMPPGGPPPSEMIDGLPSAVDHALRRALNGDYDARQLATELDGIQHPTPPPLADVASGRRGPVLAVTLVLAAIVLIAIGRLLAGDQVPLSPDSSTAVSGETTISTAVAPLDPVGVGALTFDPYGEGGENDELIALVLDGDVGTSWRTERYRDPMESIKPGVGLTVSVRGTPTSVEIAGLTAGVDLSIAWSAGRPDTPFEWENLATARSTDLGVSLQLPSRTDGNWLIWFTRLPQQSDGNYWTGVSEIRFRP